MAMVASSPSNEDATREGHPDKALTYEFFRERGNRGVRAGPRLSGHSCPRMIKGKGEQKIVNDLQSNCFSRMGLFCPIPWSPLPHIGRLTRALAFLSESQTKKESSFTKRESRRKKR